MLMGAANGFLTAEAVEEAVDLVEEAGTEPEKAWGIWKMMENPVNPPICEWFIASFMVILVYFLGMV